MENAKDSLIRIKDYEIIKRVFLYIFGFFSILFISNNNFLFFHIIIELACTIIAFTMFVISLNTYDINEDKGIIFLSIGFGFIGLFGFLHILTLGGIGIIGDNTGNISTQLWTVARYLESLTFLFSYTTSHRNYNIKKVFLLYFAISIVFIFSIFYTDIFPDCYVYGLGLTNFTIISEYIVAGILLLTILCILRMDNIDISTKHTIIAYSLISTITAEMLFVHYDNRNEIYLILGHILKFIYYFFIYIALVQSSLREPHYNLMRLNKLLDNKNKDLLNMILRTRLEFEKRINLERENTRKKEILDAILEASTNGLLVIGKNKEIIHINNTFFKMFNIFNDNDYYGNLDQIVDATKNQIFNREETEEFIAKLYGSQINFTFDLHFKDGKTIETTSYPLIDKGQYLGKVISFRDVTEKTRY